MIGAGDSVRVEVGGCGRKGEKISQKRERGMVVCRGAGCRWTQDGITGGRDREADKRGRVGRGFEVVGSMDESRQKGYEVPYEVFGRRRGMQKKG